jgi:hypothetical protein
MAKAGLSFENPLFQKTGAAPAGAYVPFAPPNTASVSGTAALQNNLADASALGGLAQLPTSRAAPRSPAIAFSPSKNQFFVQGQTCAGDDFAAALQSEALLSQPSVGLPQGEDWIEIDPQSYTELLQNIRNPSMGSLAKKSFGRGVDIQQQLGGQLLQFMGAEQLGSDIAAAQEEQLRKTAPFSRAFTDIGEPNRGVLDWFVGNLAEQGPNLLISALTGIGGAAVGGATVNASTRTLAKEFLKSSNSQSIMAAAKKYAVDPKSLNPAEIKLLHEAAGLTSAARIKAAQDTVSATRGSVGIFDTLAEGARGGAAAAQLQGARAAGAMAGLGLQGYATGVADVYGSTMEAGDPDRAAAAALGIPYAALESLLEFGVASRILGTAGAARPTIQSIQGTGARAAEVGKRAGIGLGVGGTIEGGTEAAQEGILLGVEDVDWNSPEGINRLVNSFAAGFGIGGPLGAVANIPGQATPSNLLDPGKTTEPLKATGEFPIPPTSPGTAISPVPSPQLPPPSGPGTGFTMVTGTEVIPQLTGQFIPAGTGAGVAAPPALPAPNRVLQVQSRPGFVVDSQGNVRPADADDIVVGVTADIPPVFSGQQGVLDIFGGEPVTAGEIATRMQPPVVPAAPVSPMATPELNVIPGQGALQFGPAAETSLSPFGEQVSQIGAQLQRIREFEAAQQQRAQQDAAQREADYGRALAQQQLQMAQQPAEVVPTRPLRVAGKREPQQLSLFGRRGLPRPSGAERLRRGATPLPEVGPTVPITPRESLQVGKQLPMFTQEGKPTVAALKSAGTKRKLVPKEEKGGSQRPSEPAEKVRSLRKKIETRKRVNEEYPNGDRFEGIADAEGNPVAGIYTYADGEVFEGDFKDNAPNNGKVTRIDKSVEEIKGNKVVRTIKKAPPLTKTEKPQKGEPKPPEKEEAAAEPTPPDNATILKEAGPIPLTLETANGAKLEMEDGRKLLDKLKADIRKYERFLACLTRK